MEPKPFKPSNASHGDSFFSVWCNECERNRALREGLDDLGCEIQLNTMAFDINDAEYPKQWIYDEDGQPMCTAFMPEGQEIKVVYPNTIDLFEG